MTKILVDTNVLVYTIDEDSRFYSKSHQLKVHDFEIVSIGLANGINQIATADSKDFEGIKEINIEKICSIT